MKKVMITVIAAAMLLASLAGCAGKGETKEIEVGTSGVFVNVPVSYEKGPMSIEDTDEAQVAYYKSAEDLMDFDLYYWAKADGETANTIALDETDNEIKNVKIAGIDFVAYDSVEDSVDGTFPTKTYIMENGDYFVEFVFWADGKGAEKDIKNILKTVKVKENAPAYTGENVIRIGTSDLYFTTHKAYAKGEMNAEDTDLCQVAYYKSNDSLVDFDLYYWAKGDGETLESTAALEQEEYKPEEIFDREINGIKTKFYTTAAENSDDGSFPTITYIIEDGDYLAEIVFWLDGDAPEDEVETIISTLTH